MNADDLVTPVTVTITNVEAGTSEQPVFLHVTEFPGRTYRPGKSMRRVLVHAWGPEASVYIGRQLTLYNDTSIRFGKDVTGGIRISHMSHIDKPLTMPLTVTRGKRAPYTVEPLAAAPSAPSVDVQEWVDVFDAATTIAQLAAAWDDAKQSGVATIPEIVAAKDRKKAELA
ncbi:hypothetical protein ASE16_03595 [Leifsonia sp. Root227]|nr:hypothetical protein ASE16_03595 [Leifsonia sp. Root227]